MYDTAPMRLLLVQIGSQSAQVALADVAPGLAASHDARPPTCWPAPSSSHFLTLPAYVLLTLCPLSIRPLLNSHSPPTHLPLAQDLSTCWRSSTQRSAASSSSCARRARSSRRTSRMRSRGCTASPLGSVGGGRTASRALRRSPSARSRTWARAALQPLYTTPTARPGSTWPWPSTCVSRWPTCSRGARSRRSRR